jgi:hypothetical protein
MRSRLRDISPASFINYVPGCLKEQKNVTVEHMFPILKNKPEDVKSLSGLFEYLSTFLNYRMRRPNINGKLLILCFDKELHETVENVKFKYDEDVPILFEKQLKITQDVFNYWEDYLNNSDLVLYELYPIIFNFILKNFQPFLEEQLILHGLPGNWRFDNQIKNHPLMNDFEGIPVLSERLRISKNYHLKKDEDMFNNVFVISSINKYTWEEAKNNIKDEKSSLLHYWKFFRNYPHYLIYSNDDDVLVMTLLHTFDRWTNKTFCETSMWIRYLTKNNEEIFIDINRLFLDILENEALAKTQNPILMVCFAIVAELDCEEVQLLLDNTREFSHLFQSSFSFFPDPSQWRNIILDDDAYIAFYHDAFLKTNKENPPDFELKKRGRRVLFKLLRSFNSYRSGFEEMPKKNNPIYGFESGDVEDQINIDNVYKRHFFSQIKRRKIKKK